MITLETFRAESPRLEGAPQLLALNPGSHYPPDILHLAVLKGAHNANCTEYTDPGVTSVKLYRASVDLHRWRWMGPRDAICFLSGGVGSWWRRRRKVGEDPPGRGTAWIIIGK